MSALGRKSGTQQPARGADTPSPWSQQGPCTVTHGAEPGGWRGAGPWGQTGDDAGCRALRGLGPQGSLCALQESVSSVLCKFWGLYGGVNGDLLQEVTCHTQVYCTQSPCPCSNPLLTCTSAGDTQTQFCLSLCGVFESWCTQVLFVPSKSLFPQSYVNSGGSMVGLMVTSSKRAYAIPRSTAPRAPAPAGVYC